MQKDAKVVRLGQRLRELREEKGLSRKQLADAAGLSERGIIKWELGEREPGWFNLQALCAALGVDCTAFVDSELQPPEAEPPRPRGRPRKDTAQTETPAPSAKPKRKRK